MKTVKTRSTTAAVKLSNLLISARSITRRGFRASSLGYNPSSDGAVALTKLDEFLPEVADFPARHIGPRKHDAAAMLETLGYKVRL